MGAAVSIFYFIKFSVEFIPLTPCFSGVSVAPGGFAAVLTALSADERGAKPLKRLELAASQNHRAEATVLMRNVGNADKLSALRVAPEFFKSFIFI